MAWHGSELNDDTDEHQLFDLIETKLNNLPTDRDHLLTSIPFFWGYEQIKTHSRATH